MKATEIKEFLEEWKDVISFKLQYSDWKMNIFIGVGVMALFVWIFGLTYNIIRRNMDSHEVIITWDYESVAPETSFNVYLLLKRGNIKQMHFKDNIEAVTYTMKVPPETTHFGISAIAPEFDESDIVWKQINIELMEESLFPSDEPIKFNVSLNNEGEENDD